MYVGNIVTPLDLKEDHFKICDRLESIDNLLPTLIIGWGKTKELFNDKVSILHKQIDNNLYWTFSKSERKVEYENDITIFKNICYDNFGNDIHYVYIDPFYTKLKTIKKILRKIYSLKESYSFISSTNMLYIFGDNVIFGVDLNITEYIGIPTEKIINRVNRLYESNLIENEIFNKCKDLIKKLNNKEKLVPYIIKNGKYK
jgi:hypothetical protein